MSKKCSFFIFLTIDIKSLLCYKFWSGKLKTLGKVHIQGKIREDGTKLHINKKVNSISITIFVLVRLIT